MYKQYHWLDEKKKQMKSRSKTPVIGNSVHAGVNRDFLYTGNGNFNDTAGYTSNGQAVHKGELMYKGPGNGQVIMDATSSRELMSNPVIGDQQRYAQGFQTGGVVNPTEGSRIRSKGIRGIEDIMQTGSVAGKVAGQKQLEDLKGTQGLERQVFKQESAQRGLSDAASIGGLARQRAEHEGQIADVAGKVAIEGMQAKERAAGRLASEGLAEKQFEEGVRRADIRDEQWEKTFGEGVRRADIRDEQWEKTFVEDTRRFDVGSEQWKKSFEEGRRQFNVGSEQWWESFREQKRQTDRNFAENVRQFDVGSEQWQAAHKEKIRQYDKMLEQQKIEFTAGSVQWEKAFAENRNYKWAAFEEQKRQFGVGSEQWERSRQDQLDQWKQSFAEQRRQFDVGTEQWDKTFIEERRRYGVEDDRWWASFSEQRRQHLVGSEQWEKTFTEQIRQFDIGSEQWNKVQDLRIKEFQRGLDMDKHTVAVWKDNVSFRDKAYLDTRSDAVARLEMERDSHEKNMEVVDLQIDATLDNAKSKSYWDGSQRMFNYASTHLDGYNEKTNSFTVDAENEMFEWVKAKFPGHTAEGYPDLESFKKNNPDAYGKFKKWAVGEWKAAQDNRLINPYDKMLYDVRTSNELSSEAKKIIEDVLASPEALASIAGVEYNQETGNIEIKTNDSDIQPISPTSTTKKVPPKTSTAPKINPVPKTNEEFEKVFNSGNINVWGLEKAYKDIVSTVPNFSSNTATENIKQMTNNKNEFTRIMRNSGNPKSANNALYKQMVTDAKPLPSISVSDTDNRISNVPKNGSIVNVEGRLMIITSGKRRSYKKRDHDVFEIMDLSTGENRIWRGKKSADYIGQNASNLKAWAIGLEGR